MNTIGIDVSCKELVVAVHVEGKSHKAKAYENVKGYYRHLIEDNGLKKIQAICAVMRKLLHAIHGMLNNNSEFDCTRFYTLPDQKTV